MGDNSEGSEVIVLIPSSGLRWVRRSSNVLSRFLLELSCVSLRFVSRINEENSGFHFEARGDGERIFFEL